MVIYKKNAKHIRGLFNGQAKKIERVREIERRGRRRVKLAKLRPKGISPRPEGYDITIYSYVAYAVVKGIMNLDEALVRLEKTKFPKKIHFFLI